MRLAHIPATPAESSAVREAQSALFAHSPVLDADADLTAALDRTGGIPGNWASTRSTGRATDAGLTLYVHGGGFSYSNPDWERIMAYRLSEATARPAFAVDYRLAPAHPFPAAIEDVVAVYRSAVTQGVPADRILLAGESAGATLVLSTVLVLAQEGDPGPGGVLAVSPVTDFAAEPGGSHQTNGERDVIDPSVMGEIDTQYLAGARPDQAPQSPLYGDLHGLPPLLLAVGDDEVLLDDSRRFADAASAAGSPVTLDIYQGMPHAFHLPVLMPTAEHLTTARMFLRRVGQWAAETPRWDLSAARSASHTP